MFYQSIRKQNRVSESNNEQNDDEGKKYKERRRVSEEAWEYEEWKRKFMVHWLLVEYWAWGDDLEEEKKCIEFENESSRHEECAIGSWI